MGTISLLVKHLKKSTTAFRSGYAKLKNLMASVKKKY
jgi:hypothetical protein